MIVADNQPNRAKMTKRTNSKDRAVIFLKMDVSLYERFEKLRRAAGFLTSCEAVRHLIREFIAKSDGSQG